ncbi:MAG: hypothetical protein B7X03_01580 [Parcubacteria group bacterium 21-58-10]|nr:MAG: hypothetical protein B7X03_01580 [Parcubacteria group bacterium 21-58-10]
MSLVVPAVLPSSREDLAQKLALLTAIPPVSRIQIDVVDGRLATPASWPCAAPEEFQAMVARGEMLPALEHVAYEIDLMCFDPLVKAGPWLAFGATRLTLHAESAPDLPALLAAARNQYGSLVSLGLALTIGADLSLVRPCLGEIEYVQFMGIATIGRQGEPFDERVLQKIERFRKLYPALPFQVDGGVSLTNAPKLLALGASNLIVGSAILRAENPTAAVAAFDALQGSYSV